MKKILIVDDSFAEIQLMEVMLKKAGYWPIAINDPKRVEQMIAMERPNLILLDVIMPEKNGFQVCRELKNHADFSTIPVIMVTSKNTDSDRFWAQKQGADGFVSKPFTAEQLLGAVAKFLVAPGGN